MKMLLKDLMLMPVLFKAWRNGQVWLEPSHSELSVCMYAAKSPTLMRAKKAYTRMNQRLDLCVSTLLCVAGGCTTIILMQYIR